MSNDFKNFCQFALTAVVNNYHKITLTKRMKNLTKILVLVVLLSCNTSSDTNTNTHDRTL